MAEMMQRVTAYIDYKLIHEIFGICNKSWVAVKASTVCFFLFKPSLTSNISRL